MTNNTETNNKYNEEGTIQLQTKSTMANNKYNDKHLIQWQPIQYNDKQYNTMTKKTMT